MKAKYFVDMKSNGSSNTALVAPVAPRKLGAALRVALLAVLVFTLTACQKNRNLDVTSFVINGEYGQARSYIHRNLEKNRREREYMLDRMQLGILTLADGYPRSAGTVFDEVYDILRTQGINSDKTVDAVVFSEDVKFWKGEPFEQAMTLSYIAMQQAMLGQWDNARAASSNSLFQLRDFSGDFKDKPDTIIDADAIARKALEYEAKQEGKAVPEAKKDYLNSGYAVKESNFTLGYIMHGLASQQLGRHQEASDFFSVAANIDRNTRPLIDALKQNQHNMLLVVSFGMGPRKQTYGLDNALARFSPRFPSDDAKLLVQSPGSARAAYPQVCDVNAMAVDHMWNNLEDVRKAKSHIGTALLAGGAITTGIGADQGSKEAVIVGVGLILAGSALKANAHADTRYCTVMPQRVYIVPLHITQPNATVELEIEGKTQSRMVLTGLNPPPPNTPAALRYVRLVSGIPHGQAFPLAWATSGKTVYSNDRTGQLVKQPTPFVLGGNDVR